MKEQTEVTYELKNTFEYAFKGEQRIAEFIILKAPTMQQHSQAAALKQSIVKMVTQAVRDTQGEQSENSVNESDEITSEMVITTIYTSTIVDANVVWEQAKALFKAGAALLDGEQKVTSPLIDKMSPDDFEALTGEYVANFTLA